MDCEKEIARQRDVYLDALKRALAVIDGICSEECYTYGFEDEIDALTMIAKNMKPCRFADPVRAPFSKYMCSKYQVYCKPGQFADCKAEMTLFPDNQTTTKETSCH